MRSSAGQGAAWLPSLCCAQQAAVLVRPVRACSPIALRSSAQRAPTSCRCPQWAKSLLASGLGQFLGKNGLPLCVRRIRVERTGRGVSLVWLWGVSELAVSFLLWLYGPSLKHGVFREEVVTQAGTCAEVLLSTGASLPNSPQGEALKKRAAGSLCSPALSCSLLGILTCCSPCS